jgi:CRISPR-associated protein Cas1
MAVCIITEQGTRLTRRGHALVLYKDGEKIFFYPLANLERIILLGRIEVGAPVFGLLQHENIDLVMLTQDGRFKARVTGPGSKNVFIRQLQYGACRDLELRMAFGDGQRTQCLPGNTQRKQ